MTVQKQNPQMINLLSPYFQRIDQPARTIISTDNVSNPPTDAELDSAFDTPANLPTNFIGLVDDNGAGTNMWLVVADGTAWWYVAMTKAV